MEVAGIATYKYSLIKFTVFHIFPVIKQRFNVFFRKIIAGRGFLDFGLLTSDSTKIPAPIVTIQKKCIFAR